MREALVHLQVFLDGQAALEEEERKEEKAGKEFRRFNHRHAPQTTFCHEIVPLFETAPL